MKQNNYLKGIVAAVAILAYQVTNNSANAQGLYISTGGGYNLAAGSTSLGSNSTQTSETIVCGSFGKGISFGANLGYMFSANVGAEMGFSMLIGSKYTFTHTYSSGSSIATAKGQMIRVVPAIKVAGGQKVKPYAKFGVVVGLMPKIDVDEKAAGYVETHKLSGGSSFGWMGAAGIDFNFTDMIGMYLEFNTINQSWAPGKDEYSEPDVVYNPNTGQYIETTKNGITTYAETVNDNGPDNQELKELFPFGSFGVNIGLKISFGGGGEAAAK